MIRLVSFNTAFFDVDDTLVSTSKLHEVAFLQTFKEFGIKEYFDYSKYSGMTTRGIFGALQVPEYEISLMTLRKQEIVSVLMDTAKAMPGANDLLSLLKTHNKKIYTVSSGSKNNVQKSLSAAGLGDFIDGSIYGDDVAFGKPNPECYLLALKRFNRDPQEVIVFEDSVAGCDSALAAKIRVIGISALGDLNCTVQYSSLMKCLVELGK